MVIRQANVNQEWHDHDCSEIVAAPSSVGGLLHCFILTLADLLTRIGLLFCISRPYEYTSTFD